MRANAAEFGITLYPMGDPNQGIVHVIGPEQGRTLPGTTIVCGDSHTATHGAFGALAFGIGTSEVEHVLATQTLPQSRPKWMAIDLEGDPPAGVTAKDIILAIIGEIGTGGGIGHVIEYRGPAIEALSMEGRMTVCNMSIEAGARAGLVAPDDTTFAYLEGRTHAPKGAAWEAALDDWRSLRTDAGAVWDKQVTIDASALTPYVTWGTNPGQVAVDRRQHPVPRLVRRSRRARVGRAGAHLHGPEARHTDPRHRCRHGVHRLVHEQPDRGPARRGRDLRGPHRHGEAGDGRARQPRREGAGRGGGPRPDLHRRRRRLARTGVLDVPGDEPRQAGPRRTVGEHQQPQLRGSPGPRRTDAPGVARGRRGDRHPRPLRNPRRSVMPED